MCNSKKNYKSNIIIIIIWHLTDDNLFYWATELIIIENLQIKRENNISFFKSFYFYLNIQPTVSLILLKQIQYL